MRTTAAAALFLLLFLSASSAAQPTLATELPKHAHAIQLQDGALAGPGAELLERELAAAQFFLIGEDHGFAEIPRIASALTRRAWKHGYRHVAMEIGPLAVERLNAAAKKDPFAAVAASNVRYPWSLPFLSWKEEAEYYAGVMALAGGKADVVWGLDQEFILSATPHLERLVELARTEQARATARALLERSRAGERAMVANHDPMALLIVKATAADFADLRQGFDGKEAKRIIDALEETWSIYAKNFSGDGYGNNSQRAALLKRNFAAAYGGAVAKGEKLPKVLLKFGATHMQRGRTVVDTYDLGSMLPELAAANGTRSFQLLVIPGGGTQNQWRPFSKNAADKTAPYNVDYAGIDLEPVTSLAPQGQWTVFDLRAARPSLRRIKGLPPRLVDVLWGYDAVLVIPEATAATDLP
jgi:hypothetical protein